MPVLLAITLAASLQAEAVNSRTLLITSRKNPAPPGIRPEFRIEAGEWRPAALYDYIRGLEPGATYQVRDRGGRPISVRLPPLPPAVPPAPVLRARAKGRYTVELTWTVDGPVDAIEIDGQFPDDGWYRIALTLAAPRSFVVHGLPPGTALEFRARAWNQLGASAEWSEVARTTTQAWAPAPLRHLSRCYDEGKVTKDARIAWRLLDGLTEDDAECRARRPEVSRLETGAGPIIFVDPVTMQCHGNGGSEVAAFLQLNGCLRFIGLISDNARPIPVEGTAVPPILTSWHAGNGQSWIAVEELRNGRLTHADEAYVDELGIERGLPCFTYWIPVHAKLDGVPGAVALFNGDE